MLDAVTVTATPDKWSASCCAAVDRRKFSHPPA